MSEAGLQRIRSLIQQHDLLMAELSAAFRAGNSAAFDLAEKKIKEIDRYIASERLALESAGFLAGTRTPARRPA
jgi:hypothetical protein